MDSTTWLTTQQAVSIPIQALISVVVVWGAIYLIRKLPPILEKLCVLLAELKQAVDNSTKALTTVQEAIKLQADTMIKHDEKATAIQEELIRIRGDLKGTHGDIEDIKHKLNMT